MYHSTSSDKSRAFTGFFFFFFFRRTQFLLVDSRVAAILSFIHLSCVSVQSLLPRNLLYGHRLRSNIALHLVRPSSFQFELYKKKLIRFVTGCAGALSLLKSSCSRLRAFTVFRLLFIAQFHQARHPRRGYLRIPWVRCIHWHCLGSWRNFSSAICLFPPRL